MPYGLLRVIAFVAVLLHAHGLRAQESRPGIYRSEEWGFRISAPPGWTWIRRPPLPDARIALEREFTGFGRVRIVVRAWRSSFLPEQFLAEKLRPFLRDTFSDPRVREERDVPFAGTRALRVAMLCFRPVWPGYAEFRLFRSREVFFEYREEFPNAPPPAVAGEIETIRTSLVVGRR